MIQQFMSVAKGLPCQHNTNEGNQQSERNGQRREENQLDK